jgi:hypothetical protein
LQQAPTYVQQFPMVLNIVLVSPLQFRSHKVLSLLSLTHSLLYIVLSPPLLLSLIAKCDHIAESHRYVSHTQVALSRTPIQLLMKGETEDL